MSVVSIREEYLKEIADAIREKTGTTMPVTTDTMGAAIMSLETVESPADLSNYYTKLETELILDNYATKEYVDEHSGGGGGTGDMSDYVTTEYLENELVPAIDEALQAKADISYVDEQIAAALGGNTGDDSGETTEDVVLYDWIDEAGISPVDGVITIPEWAPIPDEYKGIPLTVEANVRATVVESGETVEDGGVWEATVDPESNILIVNGAEALFNPPEINNETGTAAAGDLFNDESVTDVVVFRLFIRTGTPSSGTPGELSPDNVTIIADENGVLRTAIGGGYGEPVDPQMFIEAEGPFVAMDNRIETGIMIDQEWFFQYGELKYGVEYEHEGEIRVWDDPMGAWIGPMEHDEEGNIVKYMLGNFQNSACGIPWEVEVYMSPDGVIYAEVMDEGFTITRFWLHHPGSPAINYINNEFIDPNYVATVEFVNQGFDELRMRIEALENMPNAEEGMF